MKKYVGLFVFIVLLTVPAFAEDAKESFDIVDEYIKIYGEEIQSGINGTGGKYLSQAFPGFSVEKILSKVSRGENVFSISGILSQLFGLLFGEIKKTLRLLLVIPSIVVLNTYLSGMQNSFHRKGAIQAAFFICYAIMVGVAATAFVETVKSGQAIIENVSVFMRVLIPVSLASLASSGAVISATTFEIVLMSVIEITQLAVEKLFIPLVMVATALNIANNISSTLNAEKLVQLINKAVKWGLGAMLTLFVGITGLQGIAAGSADGLTVKVTKFAASNLIPMVGGILAETVETVMNCSVVIKNAVGVVGIIAVILIAVVPIVKVTACLILFRLCAAIIQPISDERWVKCITEFGNSISSVLAMAVAVVVMFVIILTIIINIGNSAILFGR
ncbi:MAG: stage III sporulation protein AE [Clostridia bacterium]|nr:stage III sporulation protein AE [Clostridia bacterium]